MTSKAELVASQGLRAILAALSVGAAIEETPRFREFQSALEVFLPTELGLRYESFDAFRFAVARKRAPGEAELVGLALLSTRCGLKGRGSFLSNRVLATLQAATRERLLSQGVGLRPRPWAGVSRPVGPGIETGAFVLWRAL